MSRPSTTSHPALVAPPLPFRADGEHQRCVAARHTALPPSSSWCHVPHRPLSNTAAPPAAPSCTLSRRGTASSPSHALGSPSTVLCRPRALQRRRLVARGPASPSHPLAPPPRASAGLARLLRLRLPRPSCVISWLVAPRSSAATRARAAVLLMRAHAAITHPTGAVSRPRPTATHPNLAVTHPSAAVMPQGHLCAPSPALALLPGFLAMPPVNLARRSHAPAEALAPRPRAAVLLLLSAVMRRRLAP
ncbi:hypothetical protein DENSPDRAFT_886845 [Dentipellis sp. KUC8613]|nr:hypothetical protein DENSPDRAFT_886845 [Dentipellis sp. KUC8613]